MLFPNGMELLPIMWYDNAWINPTVKHTFCHHWNTDCQRLSYHRKQPEHAPKIVECWVLYLSWAPVCLRRLRSKFISKLIWKQNVDELVGTLNLMPICVLVTNLPSCCHVHQHLIQHRCLCFFNKQWRVQLLYQPSWNCVPGGSWSEVQWLWFAQN